MKKNSSWLSMSSAPKDGTMILVTETPNGEAWNVVPACWMAYTTEYKLDEQRMEQFNRLGCSCKLPDNTEDGRWWGVCQTRWNDEGPLYTRFKPLAITPICWMPFPDMEDLIKLRRRMAQLYRKQV